MSISFHFQSPAKLRHRRNLKLFINSLTQLEGKSVDTLEFIFCNNEYLLEINRQYLQHDYYTDVITFDMSASPKDDLNGEIYISTEMVKQNAAEYQVDFQYELERVIFHAVLHLCGYKDKNKKDKLVMRGKEDLYLDMFHGEHSLTENKRI